jgi:hypothetical protein
VAPLRRSSPGSITPIPHWLHSGDPRQQSTNAAIKSAESVCGVYGYGTVDERACRRRQWQKMRDECAALRSKEAFVGAQQREAHRRNQTM